MFIPNSLYESYNSTLLFLLYLSFQNVRRHRIASTNNLKIYLSIYISMYQLFSVAAMQKTLLKDIFVLKNTRKRKFCFIHKI